MNIAQNELAELRLDQEERRLVIEGLNDETLESEKRLQEDAKKAGTICGLSIYTPIISPTCPESVKKLYTTLADLRAKQNSQDEILAGIDDAIDDQLDRIACLENRQRGEKCHIWEILPDAPNIAMLQSKMNDIESRVSEFAENTINLLVSLLLKTIAIPLLFIYLLLKIVRVNWGRI